MRPLWRRALSGDIEEGWLTRRAGRDQPGANGDHWDSEDQDEDRRPDPGPGPEWSGSVMPDRDLVPEDHWADRNEVPVVPEFWRDPGHAAREAWGRAKHWTKFHAARTPLYAGRNLLWAPTGLYRVTVGMFRWVTDYESRVVLWDAHEHARQTGEWATYKQLRKSLDTRQNQRLFVALCLALVLAALGYLVLTNPVLVVLVAPFLVLALGYLGRPMDRPYFESSVVSAPEARKVTPDMVLLALHAAKLCKETTGPEAPEIVAPGVHRDGPGFGVIVDLPLGPTAAQAVRRVKEIAAGFRISDRRLTVEEGEHAGQVHMWIADEDPLSRPPQPSPLVQASRFDIWREVPFGRDVKGEMVSFLLLWTNVLIGALPRMGKTYLLRLLVAAAALDPYVRLLLWDGKGGKDHAPFERVAHAFGAGASDETAKALLATAIDLVRDMDERYAKLAKLPVDRCPDGKLTKALAQDRKLDMPVTFLAIDEFQVYLQNKAYGAKILEALTVLAQRGPAIGIILALATQRPSSKIMQTDFRDLFGTRIALRMVTDEASEMILGSGANRAGWNSARFKATDKGVCILLGADDGALVDKGGQVVNAHLMDLPAAVKVAERARALREGAGTLSGVAAGEMPEDLSDQVLEHVAAAFEGEEQAHSRVLVARMAATYPGLYETWDANDLAAALGRYGVERPVKGQVWATPLEGGSKGNGRGFTLRAVLDVLVERAGEVPDTAPDEPPENP